MSNHRLARYSLLWGGAVALWGCSFDFGSLRESPTGSGGAGGASVVSSQVASGVTTWGVTSTANSSASNGVTNSSVSASVASASASASVTASSSSGTGPVGPCGMLVDDFSDSNVSGGIWHTDDNADFDSMKANAHLDFFHDQVGIWALDANKTVLHQCWVSVKVDATTLVDSSSKSYIDWKDDDSNEIRVEVDKDHTLWGHIVASGQPDVTFIGTAKEEIRFREENGMVFVETKDHGDATWLPPIGSASSPAWLSNMEAFGFGGAHNVLSATKESVSFDNVNLPDAP